MGLFSSLKNFVTGGGATVTLETSKAVVGKPCTFNINIAVKDDDIKANNVYLRVKCEVKNNEFTIAYGKSEKEGEKGPIEATKREGFASVYNVEEKIAGETTYNKGGNYPISKEITLPSDKLASKDGKVIWSAYAALDMKGNDPDSGWQKFDVVSAQSIADNLMSSNMLKDSDLADLKWGTRMPVMAVDKESVRLELRLMGTYDLNIVDVATVAHTFDNSKSNVEEHMRIVLVTMITDEVGEMIAHGKISEKIEISSAELTKRVSQKFSTKASGFGLGVSSVQLTDIILERR